MRTLFGRGEHRGNPFENPATPLTDAGLLNFFGGTPTAANVPVSEESSLQFAAVYRCVQFLSGLVAGLPLKCYRYKDKSEVTVPALQSAWLGTTPFEMWETVMVHLLLWGNAYVHKVRNGSGTIVELRPIHPSRVFPKIVGPDADSPDVNKVFEVMNKNGVAQPYTTRDIMHIPGMSYDGIRGLGPVGLMRQTIAIGQAADKLAARLFGNGNLTSGVLQTDRILSQEQADMVKARWREKMAGLDHSHDIAILDAGTTFHPIALPPEDAQFLQSRRWQTVEVARWFGIPPHLVGDVEKSTSWGTGIEQQNIAFVSYTVRSWLTRIEQRITREVVEPSTQYAEFLVDGLLRGDTAARYAAYAVGIEWGWMTRNEARVKENLPPIDGLDEPLTPAQAKVGVSKETGIPGAGASDPGADDPDDDLSDDPSST